MKEPLYPQGLNTNITAMSDLKMAKPSTTRNKSLSI